MIGVRRDYYVSHQDPDDATILAVDGFSLIVRGVDASGRGCMQHYNPADLTGAHRQAFLELLLALNDDTFSTQAIEAVPGMKQEDQFFESYAVNTHFTAIFLPGSTYFGREYPGTATTGLKSMIVGPDACRRHRTTIAGYYLRECATAHAIAASLKRARDQERAVLELLTYMLDGGDEIEAVSVDLSSIEALF